MGELSINPEGEVCNSTGVCWARCHTFLMAKMNGEKRFLKKKNEKNVFSKKQENHFYSQLSRALIQKKSVPPQVFAGRHDTHTHTSYLKNILIGFQKSSFLNLDKNSQFFFLNIFFL